METFNLRKPNDVAGTEEYHVNISNRFAALENLDDCDVDDIDVDINLAWECIRENIKASTTQSLGYYEFKQHKPWFNEVFNY